MIRVERTTSDMVTIRFTSYEWNARNLYEMLRRCLELSSDQTVIPSLPSIWLELAELTQNTFILSSLKLAESSSSQSGPAQQQLSVIDVDIPQSSSTSSSDSGATSLSSPRAADSCIPASMAASRFDQNSSRHLSQLLDTLSDSLTTQIYLSRTKSIWRCLQL
ncbi:uncharacterized protein LOC124337195 [Daphnia pulicaria]|uniref:uncharacterized protein LOC124337195 n=1 Tax=Daphnia pulicaria TaxID=35523 RepID=UPI001EECC084|nr:uncharacterized protein LOC124337195 [Daphnia pulicaria]